MCPKKAEEEDTERENKMGTDNPNANDGEDVLEKERPSNQHGMSTTVPHSMGACATTAKKDRPNGPLRKYTVQAGG